MPRRTLLIQGSRKKMVGVKTSLPRQVPAAFLMAAAVIVLMLALLGDVGCLVSSLNTHSSGSFTTFAHAADAAAATAAEPTKMRGYFGMLRMEAIDSANIMAGLLATVHRANTENYIDGATFELNVTTVPCATIAECTHLSLEMEAMYVQPFLDSIGNYTAIFRPNQLLATRVIDAARAAGGVFVVDPVTIRRSDLTKEAPPHVINFAMPLENELAHIFTFMTQTNGCAFSGKLYEDFSEWMNMSRLHKKCLRMGVCRNLRHSTLEMRPLRMSLGSSPPSQGLGATWPY